MQTKCAGCGIVFQYTDPSKAGYIKQDLLNDSERIIYCERCFRLKHYNDDINIHGIDYDHQELFIKAKEEKSLIVYILDVFNLSSSLLTEFHQKMSFLDCLVVANKYDLLSKSISKNKADTYIRNYLKSNNLKFKDLILVSSYKEDEILELIDKINVHSKAGNIYFVGVSNVGKSSILNKINKLSSNNKAELTVSNLLKTTLGEIRIPFFDKYIIDTPGVVKDNQYPFYLSKKTLEIITPKKPIKPKVYQLQSSQSIFINGFAQIDFLSGSSISLVTYFENNLLIHRTKLENAVNFFKLHQNELLNLPSVEELEKLGQRKKYIFNIENKKDIVISGLGFFSITGKTKIELWVYEKIKVYMRDALI